MAALGAGAGNNIVAGVAQEPTIFRKYVSDSMIKRQLEKTRKFSKNAIKDKTLFNCVNLVVLIMGLIEKEDKYLSICTTRDRGTLWHELNLITREVCKKAGLKYLGEEYSGTGENSSDPGSHMKVKLISPLSNFTTELIKIGNTLPNRYATPIGVTFEGAGLSHLVLLRKTDTGLLELIDPQLIGMDNTYPLQYIINRAVDCNPFDKKITQIIYFEGPSIDPKYLRKAKSSIANIVMDEEPIYQNQLAIAAPASAVGPIFSHLLPPSSPEARSSNEFFFGRPISHSGSDYNSDYGAEYRNTAFDSMGPPLMKGMVKAYVEKNKNDPHWTINGKRLDKVFANLMDKENTSQEELEYIDALEAYTDTYGFSGEKLNVSDNKVAPLTISTPKNQGLMAMPRSNSPASFSPKSPEWYNMGDLISIAKKRFVGPGTPPFPNEHAAKPPRLNFIRNTASATVSNTNAATKEATTPPGTPPPLKLPYRISSTGLLIPSLNKKKNNNTKKNKQEGGKRRGTRKHRS